LRKRGLNGTLHYADADRHLPYYLEENTLRYNRRTARSRDLLFQGPDRSNTRLDTLQRDSGCLRHLM
jgi:hypothetical protein